MTSPDEMTAGERARVLAAIEGQRPVRMIRPSDGRNVPVAADRVQERLAAGYRLAEEDEQ
ncbi:hypothetical protein [Dactylosporangium sp. CA-139066]|uniref:hypothetical protein n=1 Tax=Dactylosporangium sp. CA-139066 TaxID=3239930 RepID=UPI003D8DB5AB